MSFFQNQFNIGSLSIENVRRYFFTKHRRFIQQPHFKKLTQQQPQWSTPPHHKDNHSNIVHNEPDDNDKDIFSFPNKSHSPRSPQSPRSPRSPSHKKQQECYEIPIEIPVIEKVYHLKVNFAESMYRVIIHDNGLEYMYTPERYITLAIPSIKRPFAKQVIENIMVYKNAIVLTVPHKEAVFYMKKLQRYSFTVTLDEA
jgi:hypothetical protein